jgi:hypothetical protein
MKYCYYPYEEINCLYPLFIEFLSKAKSKVFAQARTTISLGADCFEAIF